MGKPKRRGGVQTPEAKKKAGDRLREHHKVKKTKPDMCEDCQKLPPASHILIDGQRTWLCRICLCKEVGDYSASELERHTRTGYSSLGTARE